MAEPSNPSMSKLGNYPGVIKPVADESELTAQDKYASERLVSALRRSIDAAQTKADLLHVKGTIERLSMGAKPGEIVAAGDLKQVFGHLRLNIVNALRAKIETKLDAVTPAKQHNHGATPAA